MPARRRTRLTDEEAAEILERLDGPATRAGHRLRGAALALTPSAETSQSEAHRRRVKDVMLREFQRDSAGDLATVPPRDVVEVEQATHAPVAVNVVNVRVDMADLDGVDHATALADAQKFVQIAEQARRNV